MTDEITRYAEQIWADSRMRADERKRGTALNTQLNVTMIIEAIHAAAALEAIRIVAELQPTTKLHERIGALEGANRELRREITETRKEFRQIITGVENAD